MSINSAAGAHFIMLIIITVLHALNLYLRIYALMYYTSVRIYLQYGI